MEQQYRRSARLGGGMFIIKSEVQDQIHNTKKIKHCDSGVNVKSQS